MKYGDGKYVGEYVLVREGQGRYAWNDGRKYKGGWDNDQISGLGLYRWPSKQKYEGEWKFNKINGIG